MCSCSRRTPSTPFCKHGSSLRLWRWPKATRSCRTWRGPGPGGVSKTLTLQQTPFHFWDGACACVRNRPSLQEAAPTELTQELLAHIGAAQAAYPAMANSLTEVLLLLMTRLRQRRLQQVRMARCASSGRVLRGRGSHELDGICGRGAGMGGRNL